MQKTGGVSAWRGDAYFARIVADSANNQVESSIHIKAFQ